MSIHSDHHITQDDANHSGGEPETIAQTKRPSLQPPHQPLSRPPRKKHERWFIGSALFLIALAVVLGSVFLVQVATHSVTLPTPASTGVALPTSAPTVAATSPLAPATTSPLTSTPFVGSYQPISTLWMSSTTTGWAVTTTHLVLHTTNGGDRWQDVTPPYPAGTLAQLPPAFTALNGASAWVAVSENQLPDGSMPGVVFRTSNGGQSWQKATLPPGLLGVSSIQFVNAQYGWVLASIGGGAAGSHAVDLFRTPNGGQTWSLVARSQAGSQPGVLPSVGQKSGMGWASATTGWITGSIGAAPQGTLWLYRTQNGGRNWQPQSLSLPFLQAVVATQPPVFFNPIEGILPVTFSNGEGTSLVVYATHNGGNTWSHSVVLPMIDGVWDFPTMQQGWVVGSDGTTLNKTSDSGQHWTSITPSANFRHISQLDFVSAREGWAVSTVNPDVPTLLKTRDGGQTWVQISSAKWSVVPSPNGNGMNGLRAVAAVSTRDIWAVGGGRRVGSRTLIEHWNGFSWRVVPSPNPSVVYDILNGVTAISATNVWAVGYSTDSSGIAQTLIEHWDGFHWRVVPGPNPGSGGNILMGIAAVSARDIWAVGSMVNASGQTLIEHWDGFHWRVIPGPNPGSGGNILMGIAAVSARDIWAVGNSNSFGRALIEHWDGFHWRVVPGPNPGSKGNALTAVAAVSVRDVWAVGYQDNGSRQALAEHWNGKNWQVIPLPGSGTNATLWAVEAVSAHDVWVVGSAPASNQVFQTLIAHWDGFHWRMVPGPNSGSGESTLNGIAAPSARDIWAVGYAANNTLIEHYHA